MFFLCFSLVSPLSFNLRSLGNLWWTAIDATWWLFVQLLAVLSFQKCTFFEYPCSLYGLLSGFLIVYHKLRCLRSIALAYVFSILHSGSWSIDIHSMLILILGIQCNCQQVVSKILNSIQDTLCTLLTMVRLLLKFLYILRIHKEVSL